MYKIRDYQQRLANEAAYILTNHNLVYLALEPRVGKTLTALETCKLMGYQNVLFLTKKKAIESILSDYNKMGYIFTLEVINDESIHKVSGNYDVIIHDEHHRFGAFPKPSKTTKLFKEKFKHLPHLYLSGTPTPESFSQIYHQLWVSNYSPFNQWTTFYKWAEIFVNKKIKYTNYGPTNDYSDAKIEQIKKFIDPITITYTQEQAGFTSSVNEHILYVELKESTYNLIKKLKKEKVIQGKNEVILADASTKEMQKVHQLCSGTIKFESGNSMIIDNSKALFIKEKFANKKLAIFYKYKEELNVLINELDVTTSLDEFNTTDKSIALQFLSGREGINLSKANYLIYYNIDFSATTYWQSRERLTTMLRLENDVYWLFSKNGIEENIYKSVIKKKNFTTKHYERISNKSN